MKADIKHNGTKYKAQHYDCNDVRTTRDTKFHAAALTHWGRVTHVCVSKLTIIGQDNGLFPGRRQAIIWINDGILSIGPLGANFSEILIEFLTVCFKKMWLKVASAKWRPFGLGLNGLSNTQDQNDMNELFWFCLVLSWYQSTFCGYTFTYSIKLHLDCYQQSTLFPATACYRQARRHNMSQCCLRFMSPYGVMMCLFIAWCYQVIGINVQITV